MPSISPQSSLRITLAMPRLINLMRGWPSPSLLPAPLLSGASHRLLADPAVYTPALQYGPDPGYQPLREGLARWLGGFYAPGGVPAGETTADRIIVTGGASQSMANVLATFTDPAVTRAVWVVAPCYYLACPIFEDAGFYGRLRATPEDEEGIDIEALENKIVALEAEEKHDAPVKPYKGMKEDRKNYKHVIYVVATCANPSGKTMSLARREALVRLARKHDALIVSDDVYDFLQWPVSAGSSLSSVVPLPRLCDIDRQLGIPEGGFGNAISNGSFSKIVGPGVRTGWVQAPDVFILGLSHNGATRSGGAPSQLTAAVISDLVNSGELERLVDETTRPALRRRHALMMDAISKHLVPHGAELRASSLRGGDVYGGYFIWITLDLGVPAEVIGRAALEEENLIIGVGHMFEVKGDEKSVSFEQQIRLCFAWEPEEDLVEGVERLGRVLQRVKENPAQYINLGRQKQDQSFVDANK